jgi:hypothetical protein
MKRKSTLMMIVRGELEKVFASIDAASVLVGDALRRWARVEEGA